MVSETPQKTSDSLVPSPKGSLSHNKPHFTIGGLERAFLDRFPAGDAEKWDKTGLLVGKKSEQVGKVAFTLDPTVEAIEEAHKLGANVLITHHPAFIEAPDNFEPENSSVLSTGAVIWSAIENNVALLSFHTALDVSKEASYVLPGLLNLELKGIAHKINDSEKGYGQICEPKQSDQPLTLEHLSARCVSVFARQPRVYGDFGKNLKRIVTCTGSAGSIIQDCLGHNIDAIVCGEMRYHDALNVSLAGTAVIDLGHDVSEWPLVAVLAATARDIGLREDDIVIIDQQDNWTTPETTRM